ncbi:MAG: ACT domain-containing protein, partial [Cetobacterium sp.]
MKRKNENDKREYYIVDRRILPNSIQSVIMVNDLVQQEKISKYEAIKKIGISRSTYYKYKDCIFPAKERISSKKITLVV